MLRIPYLVVTRRLPQPVRRPIRRRHDHFEGRSFARDAPRELRPEQVRRPVGRDIPGRGSASSNRSNRDDDPNTGSPSRVSRGRTEHPAYVRRPTPAATCSERLIVPSGKRSGTRADRRHRLGSASRAAQRLRAVGADRVHPDRRLRVPWPRGHPVRDRELAAPQAHLRATARRDTRRIAALDAKVCEALHNRRRVRAGGRASTCSPTISTSCP